MIETHTNSNFNFSNHQQSDFSFSYKFNSKGSKMSHRNSFDAGYESILSSTSFYSSSSSQSSSLGSNLTNDSSLFSQPSTPIKSNSLIINCNNSVTTPDFKQQYVADMNGIYFASIRAGNCTDSIMSPMKSATSNFSHFSASNSNSPIKLANSPKFVQPNSDNYIHERDFIKSKLLRSPAFKPSNIISPASCQSFKPQVKSFTSRFELNYTSIASPSQDSFMRPTPTEEEFMELLIKNKHLPANPEVLIGRNMGLDHVDIISELSKRSMQHIIDEIFSHLQTNDFVRMGCVSRDWRQLIKQNKKINKQRVEYLKMKKHIYETTKENYEDMNIVQSKPKSGLSLEEKRNLLSKYRMQNSIELISKENVQPSMVKNSSGSFVFASLDVNCINNITSGGSINYSNFSQNNVNKKLKKQPRTECFDYEDEDNHMNLESNKDLNMSLDLETSPSKRLKTNDMSNEITNELFNACNTLFECINKNQIKNENVLERSKQTGILEREFNQISINKSKLSPVKKPKLKNTSKAMSLAENSPQFIVKNLKLSPTKKQMSIDCSSNCSNSLSSSSSSSKIDLIGSKKSKKNLKRL